MTRFVQPVSFKFPLSGDVTQSINPWTWMFDWNDAQIGLINIDLGRSPAPETERAILDEVASYGRQIGRMADALQVLLDRLDRAGLGRPEREAVGDFEAMLRDIRAVKDRGPSVTGGG